MVFSQKYCLVQLLIPLEIGSEFVSHEWPLHCTIAGVFALDRTEELQREFACIVARHTPFQSVTTDIAYFGPEKAIKVRLLDITSELYNLHDAVVGFIEKHDGTFNEPHYLHQDFRPHITMQGDQPPEGETIPFNQLTLIDMFPGGDHTRRRVIAHLPLTTSQPL